MCKTRPVLNGAAFFAWCRAPLRLGGHGAAGNPHSLDAVARDVGHLEDEARLLKPVPLGGETSHPVEEKTRERHVLAVDAHQAVDAAGLLDEEELDAALGAPAAFTARLAVSTPFAMSISLVGIIRRIRKIIIIIILIIIYIYVAFRRRQVAILRFCCTSAAR